VLSRVLQEPQLISQFIFHRIVRGLEMMDRANGSKRGWAG
jgi:hypothetical protein